MPAPSRRLTPAEGERGLASHPPLEVAGLLEPAWLALERSAETIDLGAPSRLAGWTARDVLVHLGSWDDTDTVESRVAKARSGHLEQVEDADARNARLVASHYDASRSEIVAALRRARRDASSFLLSPDALQTGAQPVPSVVGELPLTGSFVARGYELAVHALDLVPAGAPPPDEAVLTAGLAALVDVTGALAARHDLRLAFAVITPVAGWVVGVDGTDWTTIRLEAGRSARTLGWPAVQGSAVDVLDASAGRTHPAQMVLTRRLRLHDVPGLLQLLPVLEQTSGLPGGPALRVSARGLAGVGRALGGITSRLPLRG